MDVIEVDVQLFITCRLCLDEPGLYQIVPSIKSQIKFCFDIDIEPFDGLPQLICRKCKNTLTEHHATKTLFLQKQEILRNKVVRPVTEVTQPSKDTSCNKYEEDTTSVVPVVAPVVETAVAPVVETAVAPVVETAVAPVVETVVAPVVAPVVETVVETVVAPVVAPIAAQVESELLKNDYNEHFQCKLCSKSFPRSASIKNHIKIHKKMFKLHKQAFKRHCIVQLNKVDDKPNCTNSSTVVVYNKDKIITNRGNNTYHVIYLAKSFSQNRKSDETDKETRKSSKRCRLSSDSDEEIIAPVRKKRRAISFSSSPSTVDEDEGNNQPNAPIVPLNSTVEPSVQNNTRDTSADCKHKDNTSLDCPTNNKTDLEKRTLQRHQQQPKATIANHKSIQDIVSMCHKKHSKKVRLETETASKPKESSLKHKVLSLGRKVINKRGFECTGLLRYVEHKDLGVTWRPTSHVILNKRSDYVRIMTKIKSREDLDNDELGWKDLDTISFSDVLDVQLPSSNVKDDDTTCNKTPTTVIETNGKVNSSTPNTSPSHSKGDESNIKTEFKSNDVSNENKLPNTNSVKKQKRLSIKKMNVSDTNSITVQLNDSKTSHPTEKNTELDKADKEDSKLWMPIIAETRSLLDDAENKVQENQTVDKPPPRIKVKPASELMTERALKSQDKSKDWAFTNTSHMGLPCQASKQVACIALSPPSPLTVFSNTLRTDNNIAATDNVHSRNSEDGRLEYVTLHTLELPNTKTNTPFLYFKKVLLHHGLTLMDLNEELPPHFHCLVKFKLLLKQESKTPLGVLLSLFCSKERFCFKFRDTNLRIFDPHQLSAFWQWELLKVYKGDVVNKVLKNALKISKEVHDYTNKFLCLLKSIDCISPGAQ